MKVHEEGNNGLPGNAELIFFDSPADQKQYRPPGNMMAKCRNFGSIYTHPIGVT